MTTHLPLDCRCCGRLILLGEFHTVADKWHDRMTEYCERCATARCDIYGQGACPVEHSTK